MTCRYNVHIKLNLNRPKSDKLKGVTLSFLKKESRPKCLEIIMRNEETIKFGLYKLFLKDFALGVTFSIFFP